jgi:DNA modification methylase
MKRTTTIIVCLLLAGSTVAAANAIGYRAIGVEKNVGYYESSKAAISRLEAIKVGDSHSGPRP